MSHAPRDPEILIQFGYAIPERTQLIGDIVRAGAQITGLKVAQFISGDRHRAVVVPRQAAMWIAYHATLRSLPEIGRRFGNRDHTTVLHALGVVDRQLQDGHDAIRGLICAILSEMRNPTPAKVAVPLEAEAEPCEPATEATVAPPPKPARRPVIDEIRGYDGDAKTRRWFAKNDAAFRAAMAAVHPERVRA